MVTIVSIGVLGIQGAISEHVSLMTHALRETHTRGNVTIVKEKDDIETIDALIIPGGESTTLSKLLQQLGLYDRIIQRLKKHSLCIMGTCAGCVLLAKEIVGNHVIQPLQAMDMQVERNAFGRQRESFETAIEFTEFSKPYHAVFIRAPVITKIWGDCTILATVDKKVIAARQDNTLALSFHPELTQDFRMHSYFLAMI